MDFLRSALMGDFVVVFTKGPMVASVGGSTLSRFTATIAPLSLYKCLLLESTSSVLITVGFLVISFIRGLGANNFTPIFLGLGIPSLSTT